MRVTTNEATDNITKRQKNNIFRQIYRIFREFIYEYPNNTDIHRISSLCLVRKKICIMSDERIFGEHNIFSYNNHIIDDNNDANKYSLKENSITNNINNNSIIVSNSTTQFLITALNLASFASGYLPYQGARKINKYFYKTHVHVPCGINPNQHLGIVVMDFPGNQIIHEIIHRNR